MNAPSELLAALGEAGAALERGDAEGGLAAVLLARSLCEALDGEGTRLARPVAERARELQAACAEAAQRLLGKLSEELATAASGRRAARAYRGR